MWVEVKPVAAAQALDLCREWMDIGPGDMEILQETCLGSEPLLTCYLGPDLIALGGVVPIYGVLCETGYVWMQSTRATHQHRLALCRAGPEILRGLSRRYTNLVGTCSLGPKSVQWLKSMGARFAETTEPRKPFIMENIGG